MDRGLDSKKVLCRNVDELHRLCKGDCIRLEVVAIHFESLALI